MEAILHARQVAERAMGPEPVRLRGHALECRINAEDAAKNFAPAPGTVGSYREPAGPFVRVDSGAEEGYEVLPLYDPMIAKLIVWDVDREASTRRMLRALGEFEIGGHEQVRLPQLIQQPIAQGQ